MQTQKEEEHLHWTKEVINFNFWSISTHFGWQPWKRLWFYDSKKDPCLPVDLGVEYTERDKGQETSDEKLGHVVVPKDVLIVHSQGRRQRCGLGDVDQDNLAGVVVVSVQIEKHNHLLMTSNAVFKFVCKVNLWSFGWMSSSSARLCWSWPLLCVAICLVNQTNLDKSNTLMQVYVSWETRNWLRIHKLCGKQPSIHLLSL